MIIFRGAMLTVAEENCLVRSRGFGNHEVGRVYLIVQFGKDFEQKFLCNGRTSEANNCGWRANCLDGDCWGIRAQ